jgi:hypothetical protein
MAPWPGFEPGSRYIAASHVESGGLTAPGTMFAKARQPPILDRTILPGHLGISVCKRKGYLNFSFIEGLSGSRRQTSTTIPKKPTHIKREESNQSKRLFTLKQPLSLQLKICHTTDNSIMNPFNSYS